ncbi:hypothetical protein [Ruminococcus bicirculans (ex Wegman et al. 2014)]|uniref:hypothetical protein n=1 Tax=Ruminococcus bicirculans (ex Wegman et al. 2014) TaxID=1160721 RepID=UPI003FD81A7B
MKTKIIIATAAVIIAAVAVTLFISLGTKSDKAVSSEKGQQELSASPTNLLCPEASSTAFTKPMTALQNMISNPTALQ